MKKIIYLVITVLIAAVTIDCTSTNYGDVEEGFKEIDFTKSYTLEASKSYDFTVGSGNIAGANCSGINCIIIYYSGELNGTTYQGLAIRASDNSYNLKLYSSNGGSNYNVRYRDASNTETCNDILSTDIFSVAPNPSGDTQIGTFNNYSICGGSVNIGNANFTAIKYP